jgi:hypothetical protein
MTAATSTLSRYQIRHYVRTAREAAAGARPSEDSDAVLVLCAIAERALKRGDRAYASLTACDALYASDSL